MRKSERTLARCAAHQFGVATRAQIIESGIAERTIRNRVTAGEWTRLLPAVYRVSHGPTWEQLLMATQLWAAPTGLISHRSAATLWGIGRFAKGIVDLTLPRQKHGPAWIEVHQLPIPRRDRAARGKFRLTTPTRTLLDLGAVVAAEDVEASLEEALRLRLTSLERVEGALQRMRARGRNGVGTLARILEARGVVAPAESPLETRFAQFLRKHRLPEPKRQLGLRLLDGRRVRLDFAWPELKVAVEVDGKAFHSDGHSFQRDREKSNALAMRGWHLIRVTHYDLNKRQRELRSELKALLDFVNRQGSLGG